MVKKYSFLLILIPLLFSSCRYGLFPFTYDDETVELRAPVLETIDSPITGSVPTEYSFILVTDTHLGYEKTQTQAFLDKLDSSVFSGTIKPSFMINLGDTVGYGLENEYQLYKDFKTQVISTATTKGVTGFKIYNEVGNHDLYNSNYPLFKSTNGINSSCYRFTVGNISYYFLDTANGTLGNRQLKNLIQAFSNDNNKKLIFTHYALYADGKLYFKMQHSTERNKLISLYAKNNVLHVYEGHIHKATTTDYGSFVETTHSAFTDGYYYIVTVNTTTGTVSTKRYSFKS